MTHKTIVITGGTTGIGEATAKLFAENQVKVYNLDMKTPNYSHPLIETIICNTSVYTEVEAAFKKVMTKEQRLDYLFANAGVHVYANLEDTAVEDIHRIIDVNVKGYLFTLKCALPIMKKQGGGNIVLTGSDTSFVGKPSLTVYGCTKGAIGQMTKGLAIDYAQHNIRINCVCPGTIDTPLVQHSVDLYSKKSGTKREDIYKELEMAQPIHKLGTSEEIARMVCFLCSDQTPFMTGALVSIDGGYTAQ
jgi:NAD(P)-dependent dehydrogenase (short-subunit alcohol dehydrogenase family)